MAFFTCQTYSPLRANHPGSFGPRRTSKAPTANQWHPNSLFCYKSACLQPGNANCFTVLEKKRCQPSTQRVSLLDAVGPLHANLLPKFPAASNTLRGAAPSRWAATLHFTESPPCAVLLPLLAQPCDIAWSLSPSFTHWSHLHHSLRDPCPTLQSFIFRHIHCLAF